MLRRAAPAALRRAASAGAPGAAIPALPPCAWAREDKAFHVCKEKKRKEEGSHLAAPEEPLVLRALLSPPSPFAPGPVCFLRTLRTEPVPREADEEEGVLAEEDGVEEGGVGGSAARRELKKPLC